MFFSQLSPRAEHFHSSIRNLKNKLKTLTFYNFSLFSELQTFIKNATFFIFSIDTHLCFDNFLRNVKNNNKVSPFFNLFLFTSDYFGFPTVYLVFQDLFLGSLIERRRRVVTSPIDLCPSKFWRFYDSNFWVKLKTFVAPWPFWKYKYLKFMMTFFILCFGGKNVSVVCFFPSIFGSDPRFGIQCALKWKPVPLKKFWERGTKNPRSCLIRESFISFGDLGIYGIRYPAHHWCQGSRFFLKSPAGECHQIQKNKGMPEFQRILPFRELPTFLYFSLFSNFTHIWKHKTIN